MKNKYQLNATQSHPLLEVWNAYPENLSNKYNSISPPPNVEKIIGEMFAMGEFYYYILDVTNSTLINPHPNILKIHGLKKYPQHLKEVIDLIHPDDLEFVMTAEKMTLEKMREIGLEYQQNLKCSYCFRMRTNKGNYEMFHHQSLHTAKDEDGNLWQAVNIHTNIHHITQQNPYTVLVIGIGGRNDFHQIHYKKDDLKAPVMLTKREREILSLLSIGQSAHKISQVLHISYNTVTTHRRNIMHKTGSKKTPELIRKALEWGMI